MRVITRKNLHTQIDIAYEKDGCCVRIHDFWKQVPLSSRSNIGNSSTRTVTHKSFKVSFTLLLTVCNSTSETIKWITL